MNDGDTTIRPAMTNAVLELDKDLRLSIKLGRNRRHSVQLASGDAYRLAQALLDFVEAQSAARVVEGQEGDK